MNSKGQQIGVWIDALINVQRETQKYTKVPMRLKKEIFNYTSKIDEELENLGIKVCTYEGHF